MTSEPTSSQFPKSNTYYVLINLQSGTAMGLSGADWRSVIGWPPHLDLSSRSNTGPSLNGNLVEPEPNQQWEFEPIGAGWGLRCVFTKDSWMHLPGQGGSTSRERKMYLKYLVPSTERGLRHESPLLASGFPVVWDVEKVNWAAEGKTDGKKEKYKEDVVVKIRLPRSDGDSRDQLVVDLSNRDSNQDGTKVQLAHELNPTHPCQLWRLVECGRRPSPASAPTPALAPDIANQTNETNENPSTREERDVVKADDTTTTRHVLEDKEILSKQMR
ncbi:hypothetical protein K435DRAFT_190033 [Dendrothele bispora CBS 962.96]|uniref:Ricin B lectin domain-containing protein n=1 Tax=Dendrothele bispora (strain CBS 962.96) TaxID=1314807 RepID=A0A4S8KKU8_DENBC|nr:hypothetical protein K435DRAFT_190033 [Dendrothele bispora CBS 962.96]